MITCKHWLSKFVLGSFADNSSKKGSPPKSAYNKQWESIKNIWNSKKYNDFGIERLCRLMLAMLQYVFLGIHIRNFARKSAIIRKIIVDCYVLLKIIFYCGLLFIGCKNNFVLGLCSYLILETVVYLFNLLLLRDVYTQPASYKRNLLLTLLNFFEISLGFACIYNCMQSLFIKMDSTSDAIYFSFVNATSLGFGDIVPQFLLSKIFCTIQNILSFIYTIVILSYCVANANETGYINKSKI